MINDRGTENTGKGDLAIASYQSFNISFFRSGAYVQLNDIATIFNKRLDNWMRLKSTKDYIQGFKEDAAYNGAKPFKTIKGDKSLGVRYSKDSLDSEVSDIAPEKQGTWAHPDIAIEFARWCNPRFGLWCNRQIRHLLTYGEVNLHYTEWSEETRLQGVQHNRDDINEMYPR